MFDLVGSGFEILVWLAPSKVRSSGADSLSNTTSDTNSQKLLCIEVSDC